MTPPALRARYDAAQRVLLFQLVDADAAEAVAATWQDDGLLQISEADAAIRQHTLAEEEAENPARRRG